MDTSNIFEEGPSKSYPAWHAEQEAYLHAVDTLHIAEKAMEATLAFKSRGKYLSPKTLDKRITSKVTGISDKVAKVSSRAQDTKTTQQKSGELERTLRRGTRSQVLRAKEGVKTPLRDATSEGGEVDIKTKVSKRGKTQDRRSVPSALKGDLEEDQCSEAQEHEIISDAVVAKLQQSQSENTVSAGSVQPLEVTAHSEEQLEEKPVVDATVTDATVLEGSQEVRSEGQSEEKPTTDATAACSEEQPKDESVAEPVLSVEVDNPGTPEKEPKLKEPMTPTPNASRLQLAKVDGQEVDIRVLRAYGKNCGTKWWTP
eukprot:gene27549-33987_t